MGRGIRRAPLFCILSFSKVIIYSALLHDGIRRMTRFYFHVHGNVFVRDWAIPYIMVAFSMADKAAAVLLKYISHFLFVFGHQAKAILSLRSTENRIEGRTGR